MFKRVCQTIGNIKEHRISKRNYLRESLGRTLYVQQPLQRATHNAPKNNSTTDIWKRNDVSNVNHMVNGQHNEQKETILD